MPLSWRVAGALTLMALLMLAKSAAWRWQANSYGERLADQARLHTSELAAFSNAASAQMRADQDKRLALEQDLSASEQAHY